jgi:SAM-dependent methyltransferase
LRECGASVEWLAMPDSVDLYNNAYAHYGEEVYRAVCVETYGEDLGQTGWTTTEESNEIPRTLGLIRDSYVLEIGCGSGRYVLQLAAATGCRVLGIDVNALGIENANGFVAAQNLSDRVRFEIVDASQPLPFAAASFDAAFSNDVLCHIPGRLSLLRQILRVLKPAARLCSVMRW